MPEDGAGALLLEVEQVHLAAEPAMVALLRFLEHVEIGGKLLALGEGGAVDAGQHRLVRVAAPIGTGDLGQLEGVADLPGRGHVRAAAKVEPIALTVDLYVLPFGDCVDQLDLEHLSLVTEHLARLVTRPDLLGEGRVPLHDLAHLRFDRGQIVGGERLVALEVVEETVVDHRPDGHLSAGVEFLHGLGHHMRGIVSDQAECAGIVAGDDLDPGVLVDRVGEVGEVAVERHRHGLFGQRFGDAFGNFPTGDAGRKLANRIVGEGQSDHVVSPAHSRVRARVSNGPGMRRPFRRSLQRLEERKARRGVSPQMTNIDICHHICDT